MSSSNAAYKGDRVGQCKTINTYCAIEESFQYPFEDAVTPGLLRISQSPSGMDILQKFEPQHLTQNYLSGSPIATALFTNYDQFRIRKVRVTFTPQIYNPDNVARSDVWCYWCPNHKNFDEDETKNEVFTTVTDLMEAARIQHVAVAPGKRFEFDVVPQLIYQNAITIAGQSIDQAGDGKFPWLDTTQQNANILMRFPIMYFRKPLVYGTNVTVVDPVYQVICRAVIEFRNMNDDN